MNLIVEWETDGEPAPTPNPVPIPRDVFEAYLNSYSDDPVADYLSDSYGFLVADWRVEPLKGYNRP